MGDNFVFVETEVIEEHLVLVMRKLETSLSALWFTDFGWLAKKLLFG